MAPLPSSQQPSMRVRSMPLARACQNTYRRCRLEGLFDTGSAPARPCMQPGSARDACSASASQPVTGQSMIAQHAVQVQPSPCVLHDARCSELVGVCRSATRDQLTKGEQLARCAGIPCMCRRRGGPEQGGAEGSAGPAKGHAGAGARQNAVLMPALVMCSCDTHLCSQAVGRT